MNDKPSNLWSFEPLDSSFFREAKPFSAGEGGFLDSLFPPPVQTLIGAFRTAVGNFMGVDWANYSDKEETWTDTTKDVSGVIGKPDNLTPLSFGGPYLLKDGQRLYPAPLHLLTKLTESKDEDKSECKHKWARLVPGTETNCDLGKTKLPKIDGDFKGGKSPDGLWLDAANLKLVLNGDVPKDAIKECELYVGETRTGIQRNNKTRMVEDGMLYFTRHIRLQNKVSFGLAVNGLKKGVTPVISRLGGESRLAALKKVDTNTTLAAPEPTNNKQKLILTLLTHGDFDGKSETDWSKLGVELVSACIGKPVREGGWDYKNRMPKPLVSLVPAGSSYFVTVKSDIKDAIKKLHGKKIGNRTKYGYGEIAVGLWK